MKQTISHWFVIAVVGMVGISVLVAGCAARTPEVIEKLVTVEVPVEVTVVETQVVEVTRQVEKTVVVTATPTPTPVYVSVINAPADTLVYPLAGDPITLDPQEAGDELSGLVVQQLYEGLFNMRGDGTTVPAAATGSQVSDDGKTYTITLRAGMTWSDGVAVTAQQYVDGVCRLLEPAIGNNYYYLLTDIAQVVGAADFASGEVADCQTVGVKAVDDLTLVITLRQPASFLPKLLAFRVFLPARLDVINAGAGIDALSPLATPSATATQSAIRNPQSAIPSNGPYLLAEQAPADHITLTRNPTYWNAAQVAIDRVEFRVVPSPVEQLAQYEAGDLAVADFPAEETARIQADAGLNRELQVLVRPGASYLAFNTQITPTMDVNFRRAVASAIDRRALIEDVLQQPWRQAAQAIVPPGIPGYQGEDPAVGYPYDPAAAQAYLAQAGYAAQNPPPPVELWFNREGNNELLFEAVGGMLEQIGIPVRLVSSSWDVYLAALDGCNKPNRQDATQTPAECSYGIYRMGWVMDYADPAGILDVVFNPKSAFQYTGWQSEEYQRLLSEALAEQDETRRAELYRSAELLLLNDAAVAVPLQYYDRTLLVKAGVTFDYPPFGAPNLQYWTLPESLSE